MMDKKQISIHYLSFFHVENDFRRSYTRNAKLFKHFYYYWYLVKNIPKQGLRVKSCKMVVFKSMAPILLIFLKTNYLHSCMFSMKKIIPTYKVII